MKYLFTFVIFLLIGIGIAFSYSLVTTPVSHTPPFASPPTITSSFSIANPPKQSIQGTISAISGDVEVETRIATQPAKFTGMEPLVQGELVLTKTDGQANIEFPSSTSISLLKNTQVSIIQALQSSFVYSQDSGTATYHITGTYPVALIQNNLLLQLGNTSSVVTISVDNDTTSISQKSGSGTIGYTDSTDTSQQVSLKAGQRFVFSQTNLTGNLE